MIQTQQYSHLATTLQVRRWRAPVTGDVVARDLPLWLTRDGDQNDHVLQPGERVALQRGDDVVIEALCQAQPPQWDWIPQHARAGAAQRSPRLPGLRRLAAWLAGLRSPAAGAGDRMAACAGPARGALRTG